MMCCKFRSTQLTSFVAWVGVDSRGPTSFYFASDSRISWGKDPNVWDCGRKLFASKFEPEIFGFVGYLVLPQSILQRCCDVIDQGLRPADAALSAEARATWLFERICSEVQQHPAKFMHAFTIFHGMRIGLGKPGATEFRLFATSWNPLDKSPSMTEIQVPSHRSSILHIDGTGTKDVKVWTKRWSESDQGNTSRTMFSAFCDALVHGEDIYSGGEPQLVGIYRKDAAKTFGVVTAKGASYQGMLNPGLSEKAKIEWRDTLFQRVLPSGKVLKKAQLHSRPRQVILERLP